MPELGHAYNDLLQWTSTQVASKVEREEWKAKAKDRAHRVIVVAPSMKKFRGEDLNASDRHCEDRDEDNSPKFG